MEEIFEKIISKFSSLKVLVIGELILDTYISGTSKRLCPDAPVPVVDIDSTNNYPGGAANVAVNVSLLGAKVELLSVIGADDERKILENSLKIHNVGIGNIFIDKKRQTLTKKRVLANDQIIVRVDRGTTTPIDVDFEGKIINRLNSLDFDVLIVVDYGYGILTKKIINHLSYLQQKDPKIIVADSKNLALYKDVKVTLAKPNVSQAITLLGIKELKKREESLAQISNFKEKLLQLTGADMVAVTADADGSIVFDKQGLVHKVFAKSYPDLKVSGAGDTYGAAFALSFACGANIMQAAELASKAASIIVQKDGTAYCSQDELKRLFTPNTKYIKDRNHLERLMAELDRSRRKVVFTNGCFDILHRGHMSYLNQVKQLGDILIVAVNTDSGIKRLKGESRPVNNLADRVEVLSGLGFVDFIVSFDEDTPINLIKIIRPDIYTKGGDYSKEMLPETQIIEKQGGRVVILPYLSGYSTTRLIKKVNNYGFEKMV